jgi:steroid 5-alpha reductase family enzyme
MDSLIRKLLVPMLLGMWGALYWMWSHDLLVPPLTVALLLAHLICLIIFFYFIYVFNYGYSVAMIVLPLVFGFSYEPLFPALVALSVTILYGLRLGSFTWMRYHSESYAERAARAAATTNAIPLPVKVITWLFMGSFMFFLLFNLWVVVASSAIAVTIWPALGLMIFGLALEAIADDQKQRAKRADRDAFCYAGLYRKIRHPNYLGEMIFHVGLYCAMVSATDAVYPLLLGAFGTGWVLLLMTRESLMKDRQQEGRYGDTERFAEYRRNTGMLLPKLGSGPVAR